MSVKIRKKIAIKYHMLEIRCVVVGVLCPTFQNYYVLEIV
jgi:hypothetical protein